MISCVKLEGRLENYKDFVFFYPATFLNWGVKDCIEHSEIFMIERKGYVVSYFLEICPQPIKPRAES